MVSSKIGTSYNAAEKADWMRYMLEASMFAMIHAGDNKFEQPGTGEYVIIEDDCTLTTETPYDQRAARRPFVALANQYEKIMANAHKMLDDGMQDDESDVKYGIKAITGFWSRVPRAVAPDEVVECYVSKNPIQSSKFQKDPLDAIKKLFEQGVKIEAVTYIGGENESGQYCMWLKRDKECAGMFIDVCRHLLAWYDVDSCRSLCEDALSVFY